MSRFVQFCAILCIPFFRSWADVDWDRERVTIHSSKTEHHEGGKQRVVPLFAELRPYFEEVFHQADEGTTDVITRYRQTNANLRTQLCKIIRRAGLEPWPKLFQNLRATRETELEDMGVPSHVVRKWIGHSRRVAEKHYLQVTDDHFAMAIHAGALQMRARNVSQTRAKKRKSLREVAMFRNDPQVGWAILDSKSRQTAGKSERFYSGLTTGLKIEKSNRQPRFLESGTPR